MHITRDTIAKFDKSGPRYTSYPTAPEWSNTVNSITYQENLRAFAQSDKTLSLYVHIPFCETLCYFCACSMNVRPNEKKYGDEYLDYLAKELKIIHQHIGTKKTIRQLHWGGGTPSYLSESQITRLFQTIEQYFDIDLNGEVAIEIDPRRVTQNKMKVLKNLGFNRISIGVQDFDPKVQEDINRKQPFALVNEFNGWCRDLQFNSINFDLVYGLPHQTVKSFQETVKKVIQLRPDRIALYSFAHVPWLKKHQDKLNKNALPDSDQKLEIFLNSRNQFLTQGYQAIAMDHFALNNDELAKAFSRGKLYRNFMGYTVKPADEYIGVGTSAIGFLEQGFFQNYKTIPEYYRFLKQNELPIERGRILSRDDQIRQWVINSFMCQFHLNKKDFNKKFDISFDKYFKEEEFKHLKRCCADGLLNQEGSDFQVTQLGKLFVRNIAMGFDWFLRQKDAHKQFSKTI